MVICMITKMRKLVEEFGQTESDKGLCAFIAKFDGTSITIFV